ncbi:Putative lipase [Bathymodiolus heckerae thiotrophic gill symbiont]|uniref:lipase family protein n=1 Tax=Bathymodiolus heckerae thiotrophic gill symbiont TaxID=1052212 RepID=UPI0010B66568|nr:lipase family protein [Bathymodiolus heckerae thiotrophic gill symbiont]SMN12824.1 Putative lipase [Bathymodiolus heckerae thiotrophic gill symbiont]
MTLLEKFNISLALELANLSLETSIQYSDYKKGKKWLGPKGYQLEATFQIMHEGKLFPLGFIASKGEDIYISWRGVGSIEEWIEVAQFEQEECAYLAEKSKVESGFYQIYTSTEESCSPQDKILNFLKARQIKGNIYVTGHSMGGALAVLNALDIAKNTKYKEPILYSFAGPRTGSPNYASIYDNAIAHSWRVVNSNDKIPDLPLKDILGYHYQHVKQEFGITFGNEHLCDWREDHSLLNYIKQLKKISEDLRVNTEN